MIHRIVIELIIVIVLSDLYIDMHYFHKHYHIKRWQRVLWWAPCVMMIVYTCALASIENFAPADLTWLNLYMLLLGLFVGPKAVFTVFSSVGWVLRKTIIPTHRNYGHYLGLLAGLIAVGAYIYGLTIGVGQIRVSHVDISFPDLPTQFDGYRIVHVSDIHLGTFDGWRKKILVDEMDSIRAQRADIICFTGDLQNMRPQEVAVMVPVLTTAMDGRRIPVLSVLGNHDYAEYVKHTPLIEENMRRELIAIESNRLHWRVLNNAHLTMRRPRSGGGPLTARSGAVASVRQPADSIVFVGTENDGRPPFPQRADWPKAFRGVSGNAFVIVLQHDPSAWERAILPKTNAQLTLSGHTHGGQCQILGHRPTQLTQHEDCGLYHRGDRYLYVNAGLGGLVPFRLNMPNEITVITLHSTAKISRSNTTPQSSTTRSPQYK
jgi:predicted MPP superfamily phosphohydrolase